MIGALVITISSYDYAFMRMLHYESITCLAPHFITKLIHDYAQ